MRGAVRTVEAAIKSGDREAALKAMKLAEPELMKAAQRNLVHKNLASRKVSRLVHQIAKLAQ
jgi:small subunit ribosomal protein S20